MAIKTYKPTTAARRQMTTTDFSELSKVVPERSLLAPLKKEFRDVTATVASPSSPSWWRVTEENTVSSTSNVTK